MDIIAAMSSFCIGECGSSEENVQCFFGVCGINITNPGCFEQHNMKLLDNLLMKTA